MEVSITCNVKLKGVNKDKGEVDEDEEDIEDEHDL